MKNGAMTNRFDSALTRVRAAAAYLLEASGGLAVFFLIVQLLTGFMLLVHYDPTVESAWASVRRINSHVEGGWYVRNLHGVSSSLLVAFSILHMLKVFYRRLYKGRLHLHWFTGAVLLFMLIAVVFTGYCLPWSQRSYWGYTIVVRAFEALPLVGDWLGNLLRGGDILGDPSLRRLFAFHVALPSLLMLLLGVHLLRRPRVKVWPEEWSRALPAGLAAFWLANFCVFFFPQPFVSFAPQADPLVTPSPIKLEWMFTASYQILRLVPGSIGGLLIMIALTAAFMLLPYWERGQTGNMRTNAPALFYGSLALIASMLFLTICGYAA